jgi:hypothetical protein
MQSKSIMQLIRCAALGAISLVAGASVAQAQTPAEFYKGKQIQMMVYSGAGSTYDTYARLLARHMHRYIPGSPNIVVQNMVGAGGLKLVDYINTYKQAFFVGCDNVGSRQMQQIRVALRGSAVVLMGKNVRGGGGVGWWGCPRCSGIAWHCCAPVGCAARS